MNRGSPGSGRHVFGHELLERRVVGLDDLALPHELNALDDHSLAGLEPRLEHAQAAVVVDACHLRDVDLVLGVDHEDPRAFLAFEDRLFGNDDGIDVLADGHGGLDVFAGQERARRGSRPPREAGMSRSARRRCCR